MKIFNLFESETENGLYVAVKFSQQSVELIEQFRDSLSVPNPLDGSEFHCTVIYSRKPPNAAVKVLGAIEEQYASVSNLKIFKSHKGANVLVLVLDSDFLINRHKQLMQQYDLSYDFDSYIPHITISYDCGDFDIEGITIPDYIKELEIVLEYKEILRP